MARTITIANSDEVMAMLGNTGEFYRGKWENARVTRVSRDEDIPLEVRESIVGLVVPTIFRKKQLEEQTGIKFPIPEGARLAYSQDVVKVLRAAGKVTEAELLRRACPGDLDMYVLEPEIYEPAR